MNACGKNGVRTVIFLDNGTLIASPHSVERIVRNIEEANTKAIIGGQHKNSRSFVTTKVPVDPEEPPMDEEQFDMDYYDAEEEDNHEDCESDRDPFEPDDE